MERRYNMGSLIDKLNAIKDTKEEIRVAIENCGVECTTEEPFSAYPEKIYSLGGVPFVSVKDVNFYDYDGTLLYSYWLDEALALTELPPLPKRKGLIAQCWNYTLADIIERNNKCDIGCNYVTDDGKTRYYISLKSDVNLSITLRYYQTVANGIIVGWGDGSEYISSDTGVQTTSHTYSTVGNYIITFEVIDGAFYPAVSSGNDNAIGDNSNSGMTITNCLTKVEFGEGVTRIGGSGLHVAPSLETITLTKDMTVTYGGYSLHQDHKIKALIIPRGVTSLASSSCNYLTNCEVVSLPKSITKLDAAALSDCTTLQQFICPKYLQSLDQICFRNCTYMTKFISSNSLNSIGANCFANCYGMKEYDFTECVTVPTLVNSNAFVGIPDDCVIKVKSSLLSQ